MGKANGSLPIGSNGSPLPITFAKKSLASKEILLDGNKIIIDLNENTSLIEIQAGNEDIYLNYGNDVSNNDNEFDEKITQLQTRHYAINNLTGYTISIIGNASKITIIQK